MPARKSPAAPKKKVARVDFETAAKRHAEMIQQYDDMLQEKMASYLKMVEDSQAQLAAMVAAAQPAPVKEKQKPTSIKTKDADGEDVLILNEGAMEMFNVIFALVAQLVEILGKQVKK